MNHQSGDIDIIKQIDAYLKGQLSEEEAEVFWVELLKNPEYIEYLETELAVKSILEERKREKDAPDEAGTAGTTPQNKWKWIAAAASVAILVVAVNFFRMDTSTLQEQAINSINMTTQLSAPMVMRSENSELVGADSLMNIGFEAALSGDVERALQMYREVIKKYKNEPAAAKAYLNIGIIQYNKGAYPEASTAFERALAVVKEDKVLQEKAYWYLGNAYINLDQLTKAREAIQNTYSFDGVYRKAAFRLLRKLDYELGNVDFDEIDQQIKGN
ncbi:MAG: tetratricopeptide repeat protein [Balneolaceae bacterium]|nr:tetratricopeptide repeat protein [Balneolaceae bacterium]